MMFCPKCKSIMMPTKEGEKTILACKCGYKQASEGSGLREKMINKKEEVSVVEKEGQGMSQINAQCPKCGNDKAYFWTKQTRGWDEPETQFYKCTKCGHSWRENA